MEKKVYIRFVDLEIIFKEVLMILQKKGYRIKGFCTFSEENYYSDYRTCPTEYILFKDIINFPNIEGNFNQVHLGGEYENLTAVTLGYGCWLRSKQEVIGRKTKLMLVLRRWALNLPDYNESEVV